MYGEEAPLPCSIEIFSSWVITPSSWVTRVLTGAVELTHGQVPVALPVGLAVGLPASPMVCALTSQSE
jgi:hypothetical protein